MATPSRTPTASARLRTKTSELSDLFRGRQHSSVPSPSDATSKAKRKIPLFSLRKKSPATPNPRRSPTPPSVPTPRPSTNACVSPSSPFSLSFNLNLSPERHRPPRGPRRVTRSLRNSLSRLPHSPHRSMTRPLLNAPRFHRQTRNRHGLQRARPPLLILEAALASHEHRHQHLPLPWGVVHSRIPNHHALLVRGHLMPFLGHTRQTTRNGDISPHVSSPPANPLLQNHYLHPPRAYLFRPPTQPRPPRPVLRFSFQVQQVPTLHSPPTPSYLLPMFGSLPCLRRPHPVPSNLLQAAKVHQSRPPGIPALADLNLPQLVSVSDLEYGQDRAREMVATPARRRGPRRYASAYFERPILSRLLRCCLRPHQSRRLSCCPDHRHPQFEPLLSETDRVLSHNLSHQ